MAEATLQEEEAVMLTRAIEEVSPTASLTQEEEEEEAEEQLSRLATLQSSTHMYCKIVGIRYYPGVCHMGEYVTLRREPHNPYDSNAVRVDNMHGEKVGHIKKEMARQLSKVMDQHPDVKIDGTIPGQGNVYEMPITMTFFGDPSKADMVEQTFQQFAYNRSRGGGSSANKKQKKQEKLPPAVQVQTKRIDWKEQQKHLDEMFEKQSKEQLSNLPDTQAPSTLTSTLLEHQLQGLRWLVQREQGVTEMPFYKKVTEKGKEMWLDEITNSSSQEAPKPVRGGILADDMGLGKTVQAIALILANPPPGRDYSTKPLPSPTGVADESLADTSTDVIMGTTAADETTATATATATQEKNMKKPTKTALKKLKLPVLQTVLMQARIPVPSKKDQVVSAILNGLGDGTISLAQYYAVTSTSWSTTATTAAAATTTSSVGTTTLVVCPVSVMGNWQEQIEMHVEPGTLRVALYHGTDRKEILCGLDDIDVLIASYNTLQYDYNKSVLKDDKDKVEPAAKRFKGNCIFNAQFFRVILDEGHIVRNTKSRTFQACASLKAERRLCLTGTPLQNRPDDIQSLFQFLEVPPLGDKTVFRRAISQPIKEGDDNGLARLRAMMAHVALRRNKSMTKFELPDKQVELRAVEFPADSKHKSIYDTIYESAKLAFEATMQDGDEGALQQHSSVFEILTRLRQACCSGALVPVERIARAEQVLATIKNKDSLSVEEGKKLLEKLKGALEEIDDAPPECAICMEQLDENAAVILRACSHVFCGVCISEVASGFSSNCPFCRLSFKEEDMVKWSSAAAASAAEGKSEEPALSQQMNDLGPSPKLEALLVGIAEMKAEEKGCIYSQFTKFLDEIEKVLLANGHSFVRIDGKKSATQRIEAMRAFGQEDGGPTFMLCSLHAAGTGINLTRGNHCFMMDTWWNKAVEQQAQDRVHRIGQQRPVRVVRFVAADSIESRMVDLQEKKAALSKGAFEALSQEEKKKARLSDVKKLLELH